MTARAASRFFRFSAVGVIAFVTDTALTLILATVMHYLVANSAAFTIAFTANFVLGHRLAFGHPLTLASLRRAFPGVLAISTSGLLLSNVMLAGLHGLLGMELLLAKIFTAGSVMLWNFTLRHTMIYRGEPTNG